VYTYEGFFMYNTMFKIYYLLSSVLLLVLVYGVFRHTRDGSVNTFPIFGYLVFAHLLTWGSCSIANLSDVDKEFFWRFSIFLEMFAIIPQLCLIQKQGTISPVMTYYVAMLGSYRALYIVNWICRYNEEHFWEPIAFCCGCVQTLIYVYFFVYIHPRLNKTSACPATKAVHEVITTEDTKESLIRKLNNDLPLIHNIV
jgi:ER lumen protein retaining receptor